MTGAKVWLRGLFQKTVWSHYNTANIPPRFQLLYTFVLPFKYFAIFTFGLLSISVPITSIDEVFGVIYGDIWSVALMLGGFFALVGICFYARLIWVEVVADVAMVTLMVVYIGCIFISAIVGAESFKVLPLLLVVIFLPMPSWRVLDIVRELRPAREP